MSEGSLRKAFKNWRKARRFRSSPADKSFARNLEKTLEVFPELFPVYDYEPLQARLTARS